MTALDLRVRTPRATIVASCTVCGKRGLADQPTFTHTECFAKPKPCECGAASMPYPLCTHCKGSGRIGGEMCPYCPPGPCVSCCWKAFHTRIREARR